jgi:hypothetical protein
MSRPPRSLRAVLVLFGALAPIMTSTSDASMILVSNLSEPIRGASPIGNGGAINEGPTWAAQSFVTDGNSYTLDSILAKVGNGAGSPAVVARLHDDSGSLVGTLIETLTPPGVAGAPSDRIFLPDGPVNLSALTKYWFVLGTSNSGTFDWLYAEGNGQIGPGFLDSYSYSDDSGASWSNPGSDNPFFLEVNVSDSVEAVPEPGTFALAAISACGLGFVGKRRKSQSIRKGRD